MQQHQRDERPGARRRGRRMHRDHARQPDRLGRDIVPDQLIAGRRGIAFVEHQVERVEHRIEPRRQIARVRACRSEICSSRSARLARTSRCAIADSCERNARAISPTLKPPTSFSASATRASGGSDGMAGQEQQAELIVFDRRQLVAQQRRGGRRFARRPIRARSPAPCRRPSCRDAADRARDCARPGTATLQGCRGRRETATAASPSSARPAPRLRRASGGGSRASASASRPSVPPACGTDDQQVRSDRWSTSQKLQRIRC